MQRDTSSNFFNQEVEMQPREVTEHDSEFDRAESQIEIHAFDDSTHIVLRAQEASEENKSDDIRTNLNE